MVNLIPGSMDLPHYVLLTQFDVLNHTFAIGSSKALVASIVFQRRVMYHLTNTYLPTISLLVLVELTLFLDESKLDIAVTLSLTVLLVIYTFYQSIAASIPKTAYLKLIDIWLIFVLTMPFTIFVIEIIMFLDKTKRNRELPSPYPVKGWVASDSDPNLRSKSVKRMVAIGIPALSCAFIVVYFTRAVAIYYYP